MKKLLIIWIFSVSCLFAVDAKMEIIKKIGNLPKILVKVSTNSANIPFAKKLENVIANDLNVSGHFDVLISDYSLDFNDAPNRVTLGKLGTDLFLNLFVTIEGRKISTKIKLYDLNKNELVLEKKVSSSNYLRYPFLGHRIAINVNNYLKAPSIDWMDKFVVFSVYKGPKRADILIGDYTLKYKKTIITGGLNIFPKWANSLQEEFYFTSFKDGFPKLKKLNIYNRELRTISSSEGMIILSDISKDGNKLLVTEAPDGQPDIYLHDLLTKSKVRVTKYKGIDVGAHFVEDDKKVIFVSDRLSYPNIFSKSLNSRAVQRLVYHGRNNSSASSFQDYVVYTSLDRRNEFSQNAINLYLISTKSDFIKRLTTTGINQFPKFSQDGESILFIKKYKNRSSIGIVRINHNKTFLFSLNEGNIQSIDW